MGISVWDMDMARAILSHEKGTHPEWAGARYTIRMAVAEAMGFCSECERGGLDVDTAVLLERCAGKAGMCLLCYKCWQAKVAEHPSLEEGRADRVMPELREWWAAHTPIKVWVGHAFRIKKPAKSRKRRRA